MRMMHHTSHKHTALLLCLSGSCVPVTAPKYTHMAQAKTQHVSCPPPHHCPDSNTCVHDYKAPPGTSTTVRTSSSFGASAPSLAVAGASAATPWRWSSRCTRGGMASSCCCCCSAAGTGRGSCNRATTCFGGAHKGVSFKVARSSTKAWLACRQVQQLGDEGVRQVAGQKSVPHLWFQRCATSQSQPGEEVSLQGVARAHLQDSPPSHNTCTSG